MECWGLSLLFESTYSSSDLNIISVVVAVLLLCLIFNPPGSKHLSWRCSVCLGLSERDKGATNNLEPI